MVLCQVSTKHLQMSVEVSNSFTFSKNIFVRPQCKSDEGEGFVQRTIYIKVLRNAMC